MSIFASHTQATWPIPGTSFTVTVQKLSGRALEVAESEHLRGEFNGANPRGWAGKFRKLLAEGGATDADAQKAIVDPLGGYDRLTVALRGVKAWTCVDAEGEPIPVNAATVADLDDEALEFMAIEVMRLTKPHLFQTTEEQGDARKNDSAPSTSR